ncbi:hypothetical protein GGG16DRAFT_68501 [Schizophyllum commune]
MLRGPRRCPSLTASTRALDHVRAVENLCDQQRGALPRLRQQERRQGFLDPFQDRKIGKSTSNGPRSAPKVLVDVRGCRGKGRERRKAPPGSSCLPTSSASCL